jgi:PAS domain S-box-containing protein
VFQNDKPDLLELSLEITVYGVMLSLIMPLAFHRLDASGVGTICCFLAGVFVYKLFSPTKILVKYFWGRLASVILCISFVWWMIYYAENTRAGWYRFHVLQMRVQQLVSTAPAYIITCDGDGYITGASENIHLLVGWHKEEIVGRHIHMFIGKDNMSSHDKVFESAVGSLREIDTPNAGWWVKGTHILAIRHKDTSMIPVRVYVGGIRWSQDIQFTGDLDIFAVFCPLSDAPSPAPPIDTGESPLLVVPGTKGRIPPPRNP